MSNNQYFSTSNSRLTFKRINEVDKDAIKIEQMIEFGQRLGVDQEVLDDLRNELPVGSKTLTPTEITVLRHAIEVAGLEFFGVSADKSGINFNGGEQGTIYDLGQKFGLVFESVKDTVVFNGAVEVHGMGVDEHMKITVNDSKIMSYDAEIKWVETK